MKIALKHVLAFLIAVSLVGGGAIPLAVPAQASGAAATGMASDPCASMGMNQSDQKSAQSMPCKSGPCKGMLSDCLQMSICCYASLGAPINSSLLVAPLYYRGKSHWAPSIARAGLSIRPDPFPPKPLLSA